MDMGGIGVVSSGGGTTPDSVATLSIDCLPRRELVHPDTGWRLAAAGGGGAVNNSRFGGGANNSRFGGSTGRLHVDDEADDEDVDGCEEQLLRPRSAMSAERRSTRGVNHDAGPANGTFSERRLGGGSNNKDNDDDVCPVPPPRYSSASMGHLCSQHVATTQRSPPPPSYVAANRQPQSKQSFPIRSPSSDASRKKHSAVLIKPSAIGALGGGRKKPRRLWPTGASSGERSHRSDEFSSSPEYPPHLAASGTGIYSTTLPDVDVIPQPPPPPKLYFKKQQAAAAAAYNRNMHYHCTDRQHSKYHNSTHFWSIRQCHIHAVSGGNPHRRSGAAGAAAASRPSQGGASSSFPQQGVSSRQQQQQQRPTLSKHGPISTKQRYLTDDSDV